MYNFVIIVANTDETIRGDADTKKQAIRMISRETGLSQRDIDSEFYAKDNSFIKRDNKGYRIEVFYSK